MKRDKVRARSLAPGDLFVTCLTRRLGRVPREDEPESRVTLGVPSVFADGRGPASLHGDVIVEVASCQ